MALPNSSLYSQGFPSHPNCLTPSPRNTTLPFSLSKVNKLHDKKQQQLRLRLSYSTKNSENFMALPNSSLYSQGFPSHPNCLTPSPRNATLPFSIFKVNKLHNKKQQQLRLRSSYSPKNSENLAPEIQSSATCGCGLCRRQFLGAFAGPFLSQFTTSPATADPSTDLLLSNAQKTMNKVHPSKPDWYEEFYAITLDRGMKSYDKEIAGCKEKLLNPLKGEAKTILELGIGTGSNLKYYASERNVSVVGVDPNKHMEKYAQAAATDSGLQKAQFKFIHGVGEALPIFNSSMDAVVCTLVLCSVKDVGKTLKEVQRVLKPHGQFIFIEHVAAPDGTPLRFWQNLLDPLQQFVSDGCHLTRETGDAIRGSGFSDVSINMTNVPSISLISPHVFGIAYK